MAGIRRVIVVGAGLAGLACAIAAAQAGASVDVLERSQTRSEIPSHVDVVPNLLRDLHLLGVLADGDRRGFAYSNFAISDAAGRRIDDIPLARLAGPQRPPALGMLHSDLLALVTRQAADSGVRIHMGTSVTHVDPVVPCVHGIEGRTFPADMVLVATGVDSIIRQQVLPAAAPAVSLDQEWWHTLVPRAPGLDEPTWLVSNNGAKALVVPVSASRAGLALLVRDVKSGTVLSKESWRSLREHAAGFSALCPTVVDAIDPASRIAVRRVREAVLPVWHRGAALCVGAAAHAIAPHFGQAAALAVEDAVVMRELIGIAPDVATFIQKFSERRIPRAGRVAEIVGRAARWDLKPEPGTNLRALAAELGALTAIPA